MFKIAPSRGSEVLIEVLGREFDGVLGCDYFSAYRKYMGDCGVLVQFCLAHLIRDLKFLAEHPNPENQSYGRRVLEATRRLFDLIHRRELMKPQTFTSTLELLGKALWRTAVKDVPSTSEAANLARRFKKHGESYFRFITTPGIEPTNNLAEQAIRFVVIDRHITQGSRSETGRCWSSGSGRSSPLAPSKVVQFLIFSSKPSAQLPWGTRSHTGPQHQLIGAKPREQSNSSDPEGSRAY